MNKTDSIATAQQIEDLIKRHITLTDDLIGQRGPFDKDLPESIRNYIDSESTGSGDDSLACIMQEFSMLAGYLRHKTGTDSSI